MDTYTIKIDRGAGWQDISAFLSVNDFHIPVQRTRQIYSDQKPTTNSAKFAIVPNAQPYADYVALVQQILVAAADVKVWIQKNSADYFTGILRPTFKTSVGPTKVTKQEIECVDCWYYITVRQTLAPVGYFGYKVSNPADKSTSILHQLFYLAGFPDAALNLPSIPTELARVQHGPECPFRRRDPRAALRVRLHLPH